MKKETNWPYKENYVKTEPYYFKEQGKLETYRNLNLINCRRSSFGDDINVTYHNNQSLGF